MASIQLQGKIFIRGEIEAMTGLHIGGSAGELDIGGVDNPVIRNPLTREPYIPGSSLRGKMRSLLDRYRGLELNQPIGRVHVFINVKHLMLIGIVPFVRCLALLPIDLLMVYCPRA